MPCVLPTRDAATHSASRATAWTLADDRPCRRRSLRNEKVGVRVPLAPQIDTLGLSLSFAARVTRRRLCDGSGLNSEGGSGGPTSVYSDHLFDACGAEPVLDLPHGGVAGRAQPRTSSIAQLSERLRARQEVRVEVPKLHHSNVGLTGSFALWTGEYDCLGFLACAPGGAVALKSQSGC